MRRKPEESKTAPKDWPHDELEWSACLERILKTIRMTPEEFAHWKPGEPIRNKERGVDRLG